jgi:Glycosyl transferases group 1
MKILIADVLLKGKPHEDWKEGYEFKYAFQNLGHECDVFGPHGDFSELDIPNLVQNYDFVLITENYPSYSGWQWWNWKEITKPKVFWAIDTHIINFQNFINESKIDIVGFNNKKDIDKYVLNADKFWLPYGISKKRYGKNNMYPKEYDITFIGSLTSDREQMLLKYGIKHISAFGENYINEMKKSKICFNKSMSYDMNAKMLEIVASGTFMLTNYNEDFMEMIDYNENITKMVYNDDLDFEFKKKYYLTNESERENIAKLSREYILSNHSFESRAKLIIEKIKQKYDFL